MLSRPYIGSGGKEKFYSLAVWWLRERLGHVVSYCSHGFFDWLLQSCAPNWVEICQANLPKVQFNTQ